MRQSEFRDEQGPVEEDYRRGVTTDGAHYYHFDGHRYSVAAEDASNSRLLYGMACNGDTGDTRKEGTNGKSNIDKCTSQTQALVFHILRLMLGAVFLYASYDKILHPQAFAKAVYNYQILPDAAVNLAALILPWLELLLGLCLIAGVWLPGATVTCTGLLSAFIGALIFNRIRGLDIHCGCFSTDPTEGPVGWWTVARDAAFLAGSIYLTGMVFLSRFDRTKTSRRRLEKLSLR